MSTNLGNIVLGVGAVAIVGSAVMVPLEAPVEYRSMFADAPARVETPNQLARNLKHKLMVGHDLVSGRVIRKGESKKGYFKEMESQFIPYTFETKAGKTYNASSRGQDIFKLGDNVNLLLGWYLDCDCEVLGRVIEAYQKVN